MQLTNKMFLHIIPRLNYILVVGVLENTPVHQQYSSGEECLEYIKGVTGDKLWVMIERGLGSEAQYFKYHLDYMKDRVYFYD